MSFASQPFFCGLCTIALQEVVGKRHGTHFWGLKRHLSRHVTTLSECSDYSNNIRYRYIIPCWSFFSKPIRFHCSFQPSIFQIWQGLLCRSMLLEGNFSIRWCSLRCFWNFAVLLFPWLNLFSKMTRLSGLSIVSQKWLTKIWTFLEIKQLILKEGGFTSTMVVEMSCDHVKLGRVNGRLPNWSLWSLGKIRIFLHFLFDAL